jgi:hypothetical protein
MQKILAMTLATLAFGTTVAQAADQNGERQVIVVAQCTSSARLVALLSRIYPEDKEKRQDAFNAAIQPILDNPTQKAPTLQQFKMAYAVMEARMMNAGSQSSESLNEDIISNVSAVCAVVSINQ